MASAAQLLYLLTAEIRYLDAATAAMEQFAPLAVVRPIAFGAALGVMSALAAPVGQLVIVGDAGSALASAARRWYRSGTVSVRLTDAAAASFAAAGFELFDARTAVGSLPTAYLCRDFVCLLPVTDQEELRRALADVR